MAACPVRLFPLVWPPWHQFMSRQHRVASPRTWISRSRSPCVAEHGIASSRPCLPLVPCNAYGHCWSIRTTGSPAQAVVRLWPSSSTLANKQDRGLGSQPRHEWGLRRPTQPDRNNSAEMSIECMLVLLWLQRYVVYQLRHPCRKAHPACASCRTAQDMMYYMFIGPIRLSW
jgi:hypothetical protein